MNHSESPQFIDAHTASTPLDDTDLRCHCGRLLAKQTPKGIEIRCPRCKRTWTLSKKALSSSECE